MGEKDLDEVISIERKVFRHPWSKDFFRLIISDCSNWVITLRLDDLLVGYGGYHLLQKGTTFLLSETGRQKTIHLINIAVSPTFQNHGFGTTLLDLLFDNAKNELGDQK